MRNGVNLPFAKGALFAFLSVSLERMSHLELRAFFLATFRNRVRRVEKLEDSFERALAELQKEGWINTDGTGIYQLWDDGPKLG